MATVLFLLRTRCPHRHARDDGAARSRRLRLCVRVFGDEIDRTVVWKTRDSVKQLAGAVVRLRVVLKDADLFSFRFR